MCDIKLRRWGRVVPFFLTEADAIIMGGMGTQFDAGLEPYYVAARPHLGHYYSCVEQAA